MAFRNKKPNWPLLYVVVGLIDLVQELFLEAILTWVFGTGALANEALNPAIGLALVGYFELHDVTILANWKRSGWLIGTEAVGLFSLGFLDLWVIAVWRIHKSYKAEQAAKPQQTPPQSQTTNQYSEQTQPLYVNGARNPAGANRPANRDGMRMPNSVTENQYSDSNNTTASEGGEGSTQTVSNEETEETPNMPMEPSSASGGGSSVGGSSEAGSITSSAGGSAK
jgi:hypothetical protein